MYSSNDKKNDDEKMIIRHQTSRLRITKMREKKTEDFFFYQLAKSELKLGGKSQGLAEKRAEDFVVAKNLA
jgi:hypothetical protein